jgi:hypothetical protein
LHWYCGEVTPSYSAWFVVQQVCTLSAGQLRDAAAGQLSAWVAQQHDLEIPAAGLNIELVSLPSSLVIKADGTPELLLHGVESLLQTTTSSL